MLKRYAFYEKKEKLHYYYDDWWGVALKEKFPSTFNKLVDIAVLKGYHPDIASKDIIGWVKLADPACNDYNSVYRSVYSAKKSKDWEMIEDMTIPGMMINIIELAKITKGKGIHMPKTRYIGKEWKNKFINPHSEWYHPLFAKDLYKIKPEWCWYALADDEQKDLISYMISINKLPVGLDRWIISNDNILSKFKGTLRPHPSKVFKRFDKKKLLPNMIEQSLKKGIKPLRPWQWFSYQEEFKDDVKRLTEKYPSVVNQLEWSKTNFTNKQQLKIDRWTEFRNLVINDVDDYTLMLMSSTKQRAFIGNHFKMLDESMRFDPQKLRDVIFPIIDEVKNHRPILYKVYLGNEYVGTSTNMTIWMAECKNELIKKELIKYAKNNIKYNELTMSYKQQFGSFIKKDLEFKNQLINLNTDWFNVSERKNASQRKCKSKKKMRKYNAEVFK